MTEDTDSKMDSTTAKLFRVITIALAEVFGTAILVFMACMGSSRWMAGGELPIFHSAITSGLGVTMAIHSFGHISGAHVNPVATVSAFIMQQISILMVPVYIIAQLAGAIGAYGLFMVVTPDAFMRPPNDEHYHGLGMNIPSPHLEAGQAVAVEIFITLILTFALCSSWDPRVKHLIDSVSIRFGLIVAGLNLAAIPYTGASMNPARSFGPALLNNDWHLHWVYWAGPLAAAVGGSVIYRLLFTPSLKKEYASDLAL